MDIFGDARFRGKLKNSAKAKGCANNAFRLWRLANEMLYNAGVAETSLSDVHWVLYDAMVQRGARVLKDPKSAPTSSGGESGGEKAKAGAAAGKCWSCGSAEVGHDWRGCRTRTDLSEAEKAAGAAARKAAGRKR